MGAAMWNEVSSKRLTERLGAHCLLPGCWRSLPSNSLCGVNHQYCVTKPWPKTDDTATPSGREVSTFLYQAL